MYIELLVHRGINILLPKIKGWYDYVFYIKSFIILFKNHPSI